ncbi:MAG: serine hydrolase domain-containing protein [Marinifilaceae bacterium]
MNKKYLLSIIIIIFFFFWETGSSFSEKGERADTFDTSVEAVSQRLTNALSTFDQTEKADRIINRFLSKWEVAGATVGVVKDGRLVFAKGYGLANRENGQEVQPHHLFRIASVSKLITAVGIMKLKEEGKLNLDDMVFGPKGILNDTIYQNIRDKRAKKITVEHLLRHTAGFSNRYGDHMFLPVLIAKKMNVPAPASSETIIQFALSRRLHFRPGSRGSYSNLGYVILEKVIEKVNGNGYEEYIKTNLLEPAGVYDMHLGRNLREDKYANEVNYYEQSDAILIPAFDGSGETVYRSNGGNNIEALGGAGGWIASGSELLKFLVAIDGDESKPDILSKESIEYMTKPSKFGYSPIGWKGTLSNGTWWRTGTLAGSSALLKHQNDGMSWVIITNTSTWRGSDFPKEMSAMMRRALHSVKKWPTYDLFNHYETRPAVIAYEEVEGDSDKS